MRARSSWTNQATPSVPELAVELGGGGRVEQLFLGLGRATGTVHYWNVAAERVFGFCANEAIGVSMDLIIPERLRARHWAGWENAMKTGATRYVEGQWLAVPALHEDGRQISIEFSIELLKGSDAAVEWGVASIRDVTDRYARDQPLREELRAMSVTDRPPTST